VFLGFFTQKIKEIKILFFYKASFYLTKNSKFVRMKIKRSYYMNPSFYTIVEDLMNEINQINREIYPTNLHITEFYKIKNGFNYKCGTIYFEVVYSYKTNQFRLNKRNSFKEKEYYITLNEAKNLRESLLAIVLNLIEQSTIKEAKRNLIYSKATEYEAILTILDKLTEESAIQEYWNLLITPWLMNSDKTIQERANIEVTKFEIVTGASEFLKKKLIQKELLSNCGKIKKEIEAKLNIHEILENASRDIQPFLKVGLNTTFYFETKKDSLEPEFTNFFYEMLLNNKVSSIQEFIKYIEVNLESLYISAVKEYFYQLLIQNYTFTTSWHFDRTVERAKEEFKFSISVLNNGETFNLGFSEKFDSFLVSEDLNYDVMLEGSYKDKVYFSKGSIKPTFSHKIMNSYFGLEDIKEIKEAYIYLDKTFARLKNAL